MMIGGFSVTRTRFPSEALQDAICKGSDQQDRRVLEQDADNASPVIDYHPSPTHGLVILSGSKVLCVQTRFSVQFSEFVMRGSTLDGLRALARGFRDYEVELYLKHAEKADGFGKRLYSTVFPWSTASSYLAAVHDRLREQVVDILSKVKPLPGPWWSFPGGHSESSETGLESAIRETREETGVVVPRSCGVHLDFCIARDATPNRSVYQTFYYVVELDEQVEPVPDGTEIVKAEWVDVSDILAQGRRSALVVKTALDIVDQ